MSGRATNTGSASPRVSTQPSAISSGGCVCRHGTSGLLPVGVFALLSVVCDQVAYDALVVGFDCRAHSTRRTAYPQYKAQRPDKHEQLDASLDELPGIAADLGRYEDARRLVHDVVLEIAASYPDSIVQVEAVGDLSGAWGADRAVPCVGRRRRRAARPRAPATGQFTFADLLKFARAA